MTQEKFAEDQGPPSSPSSTETAAVTATKTSIWRRIYHIITWVPPNCRWDPQNPPQFSLSLNFLFALAGTFTVANLYYNHPILNVLAHDFGVTYDQVSQIPTAMQAGYAAGLLFLCPLADMVNRRLFVTSLMFFTATVWIGLCVTNSLAVFTAISFIVAVTTVTPQLMLPLVGELAPPNRKGICLSIVTSGIMLGILIARVISGTITNFVSWRYVYWMALGLQYAISILLWLFMPDYPNSNHGDLNYVKLLWSIVAMLPKHPVLVQSCMISFFSSACFTNFWTTLTFLLAEPPYNYSSLVIGLFAFIGIGAMLFGPVYARLITDRYVPWFSVIVGETIALTGIVVGTYTGKFTLAGPIIQAFLLDWGFQAAQVANRAAIYPIAPKARNRLNTAFMVATFCGQLMGTAVGNHVYAQGGWIHSGSASVGFVCVALLFCFMRGPWEKGWIGWRGGWSIMPKLTEASNEAAEELPTRVNEDSSGGDPEKGNTEKALEELAGEDTFATRNDEKAGQDTEREDEDSDEEKRSPASEKSASAVSLENGEQIRPINVERSTT